MTDEEICQLLDEEISGATRIQDDLSPQREEFYKRFRAENYGNERDGWSQSVAPVLWNAVESVLPSFMEIFTSDFFALASDDEEKADSFKKLIKYQMFRKQDGEKKFYDFLFNALLYHYSVFKCYYKDDYDLVTEKYDSVTPDEMMQLAQTPGVQVTKYTEATDAMGNLTYEKVKTVKKHTLYSGPYFEVVPNWEFYYSKDCKIGNWGAIEGKLVFHRVKRTLNEIKKKEKAGIYRKGSFEAVREKAQFAKPRSQEEAGFKYDADDLNEPSDIYDDKNELAKEVEIDECYFMMDLDNDGLLEHCIVHKCDDVILQSEENPYGRPCFRIGSMNPEQHKVTGIPLADILENDGKIMTNLLRLIQDSGAQSCYRNPVTPDHQTFMQLIDRKPFAVIKGDPTKLGEVTMKDPSQFILKAYEMLKNEIEEKTGVTRYNQGMDADSLNKTATGISLISNASTKRLRMTARLLGNGAFTGLIRDFIFINQKWPNADPVQILGTNLVVDQNDLDGEYDIEIDIGVGPAEKQQMANQLDLLVQFGTQAGVQMGIMTPLNILRGQKKKYKVLGINVDDLFVNEKEWTAQQEQAKQQPPKEDWKEFVTIDRLYPLMTRMEQAQVLQKLDIQPDPQGQVAGLPQAKDVLAAQAKQGDAQAKIQTAQQLSQIKMQESQQKMAMDREAHQLGMQGKVADYHLKQSAAKQSKANKDSAAAQ